VTGLPPPPFDRPPPPPETHALRRNVRLAGLRLAGNSLQATGPRSRAGKDLSILLIRPDHLGDMLFLTPGLHELRAALPSARITVMAGPWGADALRNNPDVGEVLLLPFPGFERRPKESLLAPYRLLSREARALRGRRFDVAVVLRFDHWWGAWLAAAARIPQRIGYDLRETRPFLTRAVPYQPGRHEVLQNATLLAALTPGIDAAPGPTRFLPTQNDRAWAESWLAQQQVTGNRVVAIHPGAGAAVKQWPVENWGRVAATLAAEGMTVTLTGGNGERGLTAAVAGNAPRAIDAAGQTTLGQLAALYERCRLVIGSDSGPLHLAVATGAPTVHLYGPVPAAKFGPWGDPARHVVLTSPWPCVPCDRLDWPAEALSRHQCMAALPVGAVLAAAHMLLAESHAKTQRR
jgi:ADP-heptose:LPS heptosyltransferase